MPGLVCKPPMPDRQIGLFAKYWEPGAVKTRLASSVGQQHAAEIARVFLTTLIARLDPMDAATVIGYWPPERKSEFATIAPQWRHHVQCAGDLGKRMHEYFADAFSREVREVLLLGADCPTIPLSRIDMAFTALKDHDVALGPALDGGYYLIAARNQPPPLLDHGQWGDAGVLERTITLAKRRGVTLALLEPWQDVDDLADLQELARQLSTAAYDAEVWQELRRTVITALQDVSETQHDS